jgi:hypothetical protein
MTKSQLFKKAHFNTKKIKIKYPEINYKTQFGLELKSLYSKKNMSIKDKLKETYQEIAKRWANAETEVKLNKWQNRRIYINIKHHTWNTDMYIDLNSKKIFSSNNQKNSTLREAYNKTLDLAKNNIEKIIEES